VPFLRAAAWAGPSGSRVPPAAPPAAPGPSGRSTAARTAGWTARYPGYRYQAQPGSLWKKNNVGDPDLDQHAFKPPGSGSVSHKYGSGSGSLPFLKKVLSGLK
jgi:hypothetical protein